MRFRITATVEYDVNPDTLQEYYGTDDVDEAAALDLDEFRAHPEWFVEDDDSTVKVEVFNA